MERSEIMAWRKAERQRLIAERLAVPADLRGTWSQSIAGFLDEALDNVEGLIVSTYWPFRGEPDLRSWVERVAARGGMGALPVVIEKNAPLEFRIWKHGDPLERGVWNIPVPAQGPPVMPDIVIAPIVGFDRQCYRLGYGGGFFDRTLAAMPRKPRVIGVGYSLAELPSIHPLGHDIPMDMIVTETGIRTPEGR
jgi:5-formyltetrahydrofolate cyclo-ligase